MKLSKATLRPGRIIEVCQDGKVKVDAPGMFSSNDKDMLPLVMPFFGGHANAYSEPKVHDEVWLMSLEDNPEQLFWFRKDDRSEDNKLIEADTNVEVIVNRAIGSSYASLYFSDGTGWILTANGSKIQIDPDGEILLKSDIPNRTIHICSNSISLGSEGGSAHPAAYGDETANAIDYISAALSAIKKAASLSAYTKPIALALNGVIEDIDAASQKIESNNVTLD